jgi:hypothetical protein
MSSILETLSLKELYTRKKNLIYQLDKVDDEINRRILENGEDFYLEITPYVTTNMPQNTKKIIIRKSIKTTVLEDNISNEFVENNVVHNRIIIKKSIKSKVLENNLEQNNLEDDESILNNNISKEINQIIRNIHIKIKK